MIVQILIVNTAFYISVNIRLKEISILDSFAQIQENIIAGSDFSARLGSSAVAFMLDHLGVSISKDLTWNTHINEIVTKANQTLGFIKRNVKTKNQSVKE